MRRNHWQKFTVYLTTSLKLTPLKNIVRSSLIDITILCHKQLLYDVLAPDFFFLLIIIKFTLGVYNMLPNLLEFYAKLQFLISHAGVSKLRKFSRTYSVLKSCYLYWVVFVYKLIKRNYQICRMTSYNECVAIQCLNFYCCIYAVLLHGSFKHFNF